MSTHVFEYPTPGKPVPVPDHSHSKEITPTIHPKPHLVQLEAITSCPVISPLGEETDTSFPPASFQVAVARILALVCTITKLQMDTRITLLI